MMDSTLYFAKATALFSAWPSSKLCTNTKGSLTRRVRKSTDTFGTFNDSFDKIGLKTFQYIHLHWIGVDRRTWLCFHWYICCLLPACGVKISEVVASDFITICPVRWAWPFSVPPAYFLRKNVCILMLRSDGQWELPQTEAPRWRA